MLAFGQTGVLAIGSNGFINDLGVTQCVDHSLCNDHLITYRAVLTFRQTSVDTIGSNGIVDRFGMTQRIHSRSHARQFDIALGTTNNGIIAACIGTIGSNLIFYLSHTGCVGLKVIHIDPGGIITVLTVSHIVHKVNMVGFAGQSDGSSLPGLYQSPYDLVGICTLCIILAVASQLQLHVLTGGIGIVVAVNIECNGGASLQGLAEVDTEGGPAVACMAQLQSIAAAVCRSRNACISIGYSIESSIPTRTHFGELHDIACILEANTRFKVAGKDQILSCQNMQRTENRYQGHRQHQKQCQ